MGWLVEKTINQNMTHLLSCIQKKFDAPVTPKSASLELVAAKIFFDEEIL